MFDCSKTAIGIRIKQLRDEKRISQDALSKEMFVSREVVAKWETGERDLKTEYTVKLADFFGVTCDYLLRGIAAENVDTHARLGLSDGAIQVLEKYTTESNVLLDVINLLLEKGEKHRIFSAIFLIFNPEYLSIQFQVLPTDVPPGINMDFAGDMAFTGFEDGLMKTIRDGFTRIRRNEDTQTCTFNVMNTGIRDTVYDIHEIESDAIEELDEDLPLHGYQCIKRFKMQEQAGEDIGKHQED